MLSPTRPHRTLALRLTLTLSPRLTPRSTLTALPRLALALSRLTLVTWLALVLPGLGWVALPRLALVLTGLTLVLPCLSGTLLVLTWYAGYGLKLRLSVALCGRSDAQPLVVVAGIVAGGNRSSDFA